jgi:hypothetical protein
VPSSSTSRGIKTQPFPNSFPGILHTRIRTLNSQTFTASKPYFACPPHSRTTAYRPRSQQPIRWIRASINCLSTSTYSGHGMLIGNRGEPLKKKETLIPGRQSGAFGGVFEPLVAPNQRVFLPSENGSSNSHLRPGKTFCLLDSRATATLGSCSVRGPTSNLPPSVSWAPQSFTGNVIDTDYINDDGFCSSDSAPWVLSRTSTANKDDVFAEISMLGRSDSLPHISDGYLSVVPYISEGTS